MTVSSIGDLARGLVLRRHQSALKAQVSDLSQALASGQTQDLRGRLNGDYRQLSAIDHRLTLLETYDRTAAEAALATGAMQTALDALAESPGELAPALLAAGTDATGSALNALADGAVSHFHQAVATLNTQAAGRSLFAGTATDTLALNPAEDILNAVKGAIAGLTTATDIRDAVVAWFDPGTTGFDQVAYRGSDTTIAGWPVGPQEAVDIPITAADPALRDLLCGLALAALAGEDTVPGLASAERTALAEMAGERLVQAGDGLTDLRSGLGTIEARIERAATTSATEQGLLNAARAEITAADPYEVATALEDAQTRLETLYSITARLSRLSLADYLS